MRIAMVSEHASPLAAIGGADAGGQNVHVAALASALAARGHRVEVYTRRDDPELAHRVRLVDQVEVVHVDAGPPVPIPKDELLPHMGAFAAQLEREWEVATPDVAHSHFWMSGMAAVTASRELGVPVAHTFHALGTVKRRHQGAQDTSPPERAEREPRVGTDVDAVIATCSDEAFELMAMGVPSGRITVIPCGVDVAAFDPQGRVAPRGIRFRLMTVSRLVPRKGVELVIEALGLLTHDGRDVELVIVGGGADGEQAQADADVRRLRSLAERLGVADRVRFTGRVAHGRLPPLLRSADVVVCAPWYEPFGIVPLEAMAAGVPVVAADVGGLRDTVVHGDTGLRVPPRDPAAIAAAVANLMDDRALRERMGAAGVARARSHYTWTSVAAATERVYARLASSPPASTVALRGMAGS